ncbi:neuromedin U [Bizionia sediminis]|uniref:Neuromedin U n=1 Tax=Bizionia sediminis TaxID=1737064 RepID=A0ABW5KVM9_9FLAO
MKIFLLIFSCLIVTHSVIGQNQDDYSPADDGKFLSDKIQNPIANLATLPIQYELITQSKNSNMVRLLPTIPVQLTNKWQLITHADVPIANMYTNRGYENGFGNIVLTATLTPTKETGTSWGVGPAIMFPSVNNELGFNNLSVGPSVTYLKQVKGFTYGLTVQNFFSVAGPSTNPDVNYLQTKLHFAKTLNNNWYVYTNPEITANWNAKASNQWRIPLGIGAGKLIEHSRYLPINVQAGVYKYVEHPTDADWLVQVKAAFILKK